MLGVNNLASGATKIFQEEWVTKHLAEYVEICIERTRAGFIEAQNAKLAPFTTVELPTTEGFALYLGIGTKQMAKHANNNPQLQEALDFILTLQKQYLINFGLSGVFNPAVANRMLSANHDMNEKKLNENQHIVGFVQRIYERADQIALEQNNAVRIYDTETTPE
jgi:hypothetical protein